MQSPIDLKFDERGLIPAVIQDDRTQEVLMVAYMNRESLKTTVETRKTHFLEQVTAEILDEGRKLGAHAGT